MRKQWTKQEIEEATGLDQKALERSDNPMTFASSWDVSATDKALLGAKRQYRFPHIRPQSVMVACIGNLWEKDAWWHLQDMLLATAVKGHSVSLQEVDDPSVFSHDAIPMMRWYASSTYCFRNRM